MRVSPSFNEESLAALQTAGVAVLSSIRDVNGVRFVHVRVSPDLVSFVRSQPGVLYMADNSLQELSTLAKTHRARHFQPPPAAEAEPEHWSCRRQEGIVSWGLDRLNHPSPRNMTGTFSYNSTGRGVTAVIVDTGIMLNHSEFGRRARLGANFATTDTDPGDFIGHGTHVASTVGGRNFGVAKEVHLVSVKVFDRKGRSEAFWLENALEWIGNTLSPNRTVINMSLGGPYDPLLNEICDALVAKGFFVVIAAGNDNIDASLESPGSASSVLAVGASSAVDYRAPFSNFGAKVDIFAPGEAILGASIRAVDASITYSGTSMAAPMVAGVAAALWARHPHFTNTQVQEMLLNLAVPNGIRKLLCDATTNREACLQTTTALLQLPNCHQVPPPGFDELEK